MRTMVETQIRDLAHAYLRHGGKQNRKKRVDRLCNACMWVSDRFRINDIRQMGRRQVWEFYANNSTLSDKTLLEYFYAFKLLWCLLQRAGEPPRPKNRQRYSGLT